MGLESNNEAFTGSHSSSPRPPSALPGHLDFLFRQTAHLPAAVIVDLDDLVNSHDYCYPRLRRYDRQGRRLVPKSCSWTSLEGNSSQCLDAAWPVAGPRMGPSCNLHGVPCHSPRGWLLLCRACLCFRSFLSILRLDPYPGGASMLHTRSGTSVETIRNHDGMRPSPLCAGAAVPQGKLRGVTRCWAAHCNLAEMMAQLGKSRDGGTGRAVVRCPEGRPPGHPLGACISAKKKNPRSAAQPLIPGSRVVSRTHISVADCMTVKIEGFSMVPSGRVKEYAKGLHVRRWSADICMTHDGNIVHGDGLRPHLAC